MTARKGWGNKSWTEVTDTIPALGLICFDYRRVFNSIDTFSIQIFYIYIGWNNLIIKI